MFNFMSVIISSFLVFNVITLCYSAETSCEQSEKLFADLCFRPQPSLDFDPQAFKDLQPADGWHVEYGNDVTRLHMAEVLQGKLLNKDEISNDFCPRIKLEHGDHSHNADGEYFGFGNLYSNFTCKGSKDYPGVEQCDVQSKGKNYTEAMNMYISYLNVEGLFVFVGCFENGEVGWYSASVSNKLTDEEKEIVEFHAEYLGFPPGTSIKMYTDSCL